MIRAIALVAFLIPTVAFAQTHDHRGSVDSDHPAMHDHRGANNLRAKDLFPVQPGQGAFAAIQEIVEILEADPKTDWSKVNIDALRQHLVDMNSVTLAAEVKDEPIEGGVRFLVTGAGPVRDSIRRMVTAHAATMNGVGGWRFEAGQTEGGASLIVRTPASELAKLHGLGFFGILTHGMHHQAHHLMIARGGNPHQ